MATRRASTTSRGTKRKKGGRGCNGGHNKYKVTKKDQLRYQRMKEKGIADHECAFFLGIGLNTLQKNKKQLLGTAAKRKKLGDFNEDASGSNVKGGQKIGLTPLLRRRLIRAKENGNSDERVCEILEVAQSTLSRWYKIDPSLRHDMTVAKTRAVEDAINSLRSRVHGYDTRTVTEQIVVDADGRERVTSKTVTTNRLHPSVPALKLYLANMAQWVTDAKNAVAGNSENEETEFDVRDSLYTEDEEGDDDE